MERMKETKGKSVEGMDNEMASEGNGNREKKQREGGVRQTGQNEQKGGNLNFMRDTQTFSFSYK